MTGDVASWRNPDGTVEIAGFVEDAQSKIGKVVHWLTAPCRPAHATWVRSPTETTIVKVDVDGAVTLAEVHPPGRTRASLNGMGWRL